MRRPPPPTAAHDGGYVRAGVTASVPSFLARYPNVNAEATLRRAGLDVGLLGNADALLPARALVAFFEAAAEDTGDAAFGLSYAAQMPLQDLGVVGYLLLHSPTLLSGLQIAERFMAVQRAGRGALVVEANGRVRYTSDPALGPDTQDVERILATVVRLCRGALQRPTWAPRSISLGHRAPADDSVQRAFFACPVRYGTGENVVAIDSADLQLRLPGADAGLLPLLQRHADDCLRLLPVDGLDARVRKAILDVLPHGAASIDDVAKTLATTPRSLQRRLQEEGTSFQSVLQETRNDLALRYLDDDGLTLTEAALLLGYSDLTAFSRAFRKWTGKSPQQFRRA